MAFEDTKTSRLSYFDFRAVWTTRFVPILNHPKAQAAKITLLDHLWHDNLAEEEEAATTLYETHDGPIDGLRVRTPPSLIAQLRALPTSEERHRVMDTWPLGTFSITDKDDDKDYAFVSQAKFADPNTLEHYLALHQCHELAPLVWTWCGLVWPDRKWQIIENDCHTFVMDAADPLTVYDILWQYLGIPIHAIINDAVVGAHHCLGRAHADPVSLQREGRPWLEDIWQPVEQLWEGYARAAPMLSVRNGLIRRRSIEQLIEYQKAFDWLRPST